MNGFAIRLDEGSVSMADPIAYFITWASYGTWLPGDHRGWVEYKQGWQLPSVALELECAAQMSEDACRLDTSQRVLCERQISQTCQVRGWHLYAVNCRSNHLHLVIQASAHSMKIRRDLKAWCTRRLRQATNSDRKNWWAERGSIRWVWNQHSLDRVIAYTLEAQDRETEASEV